MPLRLNAQPEASSLDISPSISVLVMGERDAATLTAGNVQIRQQSRNRRMDRGRSVARRRIEDNVQLSWR
jgi:hypothetical protein